MAFSKLKGIIFDIHKTLVDDSGFPREKIWGLIEQSGVIVDRERYFELYDKITRRLFNWPEIHPFIKVREIHRKRLQQIYQHFGVSRDVESDLNYLWESLSGCKMYPETPEVLEKLSKRAKLALLTNADSDDPLIEIIRASGVTFEAIITSDQVKCYKPDRKIFEVILKKMGLKPNEVIMVGDSLIADVAGAKNSGIYSVWVNRTGKMINNGLPAPDWEIQNLNELLNLVGV
jgi:2-haloacid dehalogenase